MNSFSATGSAQKRTKAGYTLAKLSWKAEQREKWETQGMPADRSIELSWGWQAGRRLHKLKSSYSAEPSSDRAKVNTEEQFQLHS